MKIENGCQDQEDGEVGHAEPPAHVAFIVVVSVQIIIVIPAATGHISSRANEGA